MSDAYLAKIVALAQVDRPAEQPNATDWERAEQDLRLLLPCDFKEIVTGLGSGHFGEFWLLNPISSSEYARLTLAHILELAACIRPNAAEVGIGLYPSAGGFFHIGLGTNRMDLLLKPNASTPWRYQLIWLDEDRYAAYEIRSTIAQFLHDLYTGSLNEAWAGEIRKSIWEPGEVFFTSLCAEWHRRLKT